jgi:GTP cyclohydrolase I
MSAEEAIRQLIRSLGWTDPELGHTPERVADLLREYSPADLPPVSTFAHDDTGVVVLRDLPYYSLCVHHLVPFFGHATVAYVPAGKVSGLSCVAATVQTLARQPQLQERLAAQIADRLHQAMVPEALVVQLSARQMCMEMRGARSTGVVEVSATRGEVSDALMAAVRGGGGF